MGIFSFLTGRDDQTTDAPAGSRPEQRAPAAGVAASHEAPPQPGTAPDERAPAAGLTGHEAVAEPLPGDQPPAAPAPEGWDVGALTAPPAKPKGPALVNDPLKSLELKPQIIEAISTVFDPEIPVNLYELGLIYDILVDADARVHVAMTLTSPACPSAQQLPGEVQDKVRGVKGVSAAAVEVVWEPPWTPDKMSDAARLQLGIF
jgi:FeS assembly SUF system protein